MSQWLSPTPTKPSDKRPQPSKEEEVFWLWMRDCWVHRIELLLTLPWVILFFVLYWKQGWQIATGVTTALMSGLLICKKTRDWVFWQLHRSALRRNFAKAVHLAGLETREGSLPSLRRFTKTPAGVTAALRVARGGSISDLERHCERIAAAMNLRDLRIIRDQQHAGRGMVTFVRDDVFEQSLPAWPLTHASSVGFWDAIPIGVDENRRSVSVKLPQRNLLVGGEPGSGKSVAISMIVAASAQDPTVDLWLFDGKMVELACWEPSAKAFIGPDPEQAAAVLEQLRTEMEARYDQLLANGARKVTPGNGMPLQVVVIDELAFYTALPDRPQRERITRLLRDLVSRGRAAGIIVIAATQKPSSDIVPTSLRDLFGFRLAMRCNTKDASDTILGSGWATEGVDASRIPTSQRGVGYLLAEDSQPVKIKTFYLTDQELQHLSRKAATLRQADHDHEQAECYDN